MSLMQVVGQAGGRPEGDQPRVGMREDQGSVESVRAWVRQADIDDGYVAGVSTAEAARIKAFNNRCPRAVNDLET